MSGIKDSSKLKLLDFIGAPECVEAAKKRITAIVEELEQRITIDVHIDHHHHRTIMGARGSKVQNIQSEFNVDIKFPERVDDSEVSSTRTPQFRFLSAE